MGKTMPPVERAARALCRRAGLAENTRYEGAPMWRNFVPEALMAIEALRIDDPASPILAAGACTPDQWNRMVDAMLAEGARSEADAGRLGGPR